MNLLDLLAQWVPPGTVQELVAQGLAAGVLYLALRADLARVSAENRAQTRAILAMARQQPADATPTPDQLEELNDAVAHLRAIRALDDTTPVRR